MAKIIQIEVTCCSCYDTMIDAIEPVGDTVPMNVTVCVCCGHLMMIEISLYIFVHTPGTILALQRL